MKVLVILDAIVTGLTPHVVFAGVIGIAYILMIMTISAYHDPRS